MNFKNILCTAHLNALIYHQSVLSENNVFIVQCQKLLNNIIITTRAVCTGASKPVLEQLLVTRPLPEVVLDEEGCIELAHSYLILCKY